MIIIDRDDDWKPEVFVTCDKCYCSTWFPYPTVAQAKYAAAKEGWGILDSQHSSDINHLCPKHPDLIRSLTPIPTQVATTSVFQFICYWIKGLFK